MPFSLARLRVYEPDTFSVGQAPEAVTTRDARASRMRASANRRSKLELAARSTNELSNGSLNFAPPLRKLGGARIDAFC